MNFFELPNNDSKYANRQMEMAHNHHKELRQLTTLSVEWCWRRDLGVNAIRRAFDDLRR